MAETSDGLIWWEKSVEYKFIAEAVAQSSLDLLWPLDGSYERVGDAVFSKNASYLIVEFKDELSSFSSEYRKYRSDKDASDGEGRFQSAKDDLGVQSHHLLIWGEVLDGKLKLMMKKYFDCNVESAPESLDLIAAFARGACIKDFSSYVKNLSNWKFIAGKDDDEIEGESGGASASGKSTAKIIGVESGRLAIYDYSDKLAMELNKKFNKKPGQVI